MAPRSAGAGGARRPPLTREKVLAGAIVVADRDGLAALTMRSLADEVGVKPMSLYHHVANKDDLLDGIVDAVFAEIDLPAAGDPWREALRSRAVSAREALVRHPWATPLMDSRPSPGPATLRHHDTLIGVMRAAGFSLEMTAHALSLVDAYVYGYCLQEEAIPVETPEQVPAIAEDLAAWLSPDEHPHLFELTTDHVLQPGYDYAEEFLWGLDLVLDGLAARL